MEFSKLACIASVLLPLAATSPVPALPQSSLPAYDVLIVGGGPAGLSAASALGRVNRSALLIDSGVYRNAATREIHDVIGNDGINPSAFRALARDQISVYTSVSMMNGTATSVTPEMNGTYFTTTDAAGKRYLSKKVILATGVKDLLPNTPGLAAGWGKGIYGCPWCDGWEHRDKPFANLGTFSASFVQNTVRTTTLNPKPLMLTNGTFNNDTMAKASATLPSWEKQLALYNIEIENRIIVSFSRLHGDDGDCDDDFIITFEDNSTVVRNSIKGNFPATLASDLPEQMGLKLTEDDGEGISTVVVDKNKESSILGVFMVGDANSDDSFNVPHAMWSAKRAVVYIHEELLAKEYAEALVESSQHAEQLWDVHESFEAMKIQLAQRIVNHKSAEELLEYLEKF
ncbi:hypothetical protein MMC28_007494 [Mycoblastus sanguinarius]|nr:hypothetical protein [Mycoblastus sanguinarius]